MAFDDQGLICAMRRAPAQGRLENALAALRTAERMLALLVGKHARWPGGGV